MKTSHRFSPLLMMAVATLALTACDDSSKTAEETAAPAGTEVSAEVAPAAATVTVSDATSFATAEGATTGAVFLKITNAGTEADRLIGATTTVAQGVEIHATETDAAGVAQMRKIDAVDIAAGQTVELKADGTHLMLMGLTQPIAAGTTFDITLDLEKGADVLVPVTVVSPVAAAAANVAEEAADVAKDAADTAVEAAGEAADAAGEAADAAGEAVKDAAETAVEETKEVIEEVAPAPSEVPASDAKTAE
jgi:hypothetical protein